ncbi:MAG: sensor histidine kinase [Acidimicrobiales bacterium]
MGASAAQFEFAAEIVTFLVALAGFALVLLRAQLYGATLWRSVALGAAFASLGTAAFIHGAVSPQVSAPPAVTGLRLGAAVLFAVLGISRRGRSGLPGPALLGGAVLVSAAGVAAYWLTQVTAESLLLAGSLVIGGAVAYASRGSIGAKLTATAGATLLLIVVVLSVALSTVLSNTVRDDAIKRLQGRADRAAASASTAWQSDLQDAKLVSSSVQGLGLAAPVAAGTPGAQARLATGLSALSTQFFSNVALEWVGPDGRVEAISPQFGARFGPSAASDLAGTNLVRRALSISQPAGTSGVIGRFALAVGAYPDSAGGSVLGVALAVSPLDSSFLDSQIGDDTTLSAVLVSDGVPLSWYPRTTPRPDPAELALARSYQAGRPTPAITSDGRYTAGASVLAGTGRPAMVVLVETSTSEVDATRQSLFHDLFLIALGGSIIAFLVSVLISDRINRGLEQLTAAARRISRGESEVRTGVVASDEIGVLGEAFDSMAASIEEKTSALRQAALDEAALRGRLESVVSGMGEALMALDPSGRITEFNVAAERLTGRARARSLGRPAAPVLEVRLDGGGDLMARVSAGLERPFISQGTLVRTDGLVPVSVSAAPYEIEPGEATGAVVLLRDLRPERELERMKTEFLSRIGHELRTPLTAILGFARLLASRPVPPAQAEVLHGQILQQSNRLLRTVEMLEFFASAGANRLGLDPARLSARELLDDASGRWAGRIGPEQELRWQVTRGLPEVEADRRWIGLALDELIDNAVKFSPDGVKVRVTATHSPEGGLALAVTDRGQGMSEEDLAGVFEEFVQGDSSDTRRFGGLGLGLPLAQRVVEAHGGRIEVSSRPGRGSSFTVILPPADRRPRRRAQPRGSRA